jgi:hypothetical protein
MKSSYAAEAQFPDSSQRFVYTLLHEANKQIRVVQIQPSSDERSPIHPLIVPMNLGGCGEAGFLNFQKGWRHHEKAEPSYSNTHQLLVTERCHIPGDR